MKPPSPRGARGDSRLGEVRRGGRRTQTLAAPQDVPSHSAHIFHGKWDITQSVTLTLSRIRPALLLEQDPTQGAGPPRSPPALPAARQLPCPAA